MHQSSSVKMKEYTLIFQAFLIFFVAQQVKGYPETYVRSFPLYGFECFPDNLRLSCDGDTGKFPCCADKGSGEYYMPAYIRWSDWIPCDLCNDECNENDECRIMYEEIPQLNRLQRSLWDDAGEGRRNKRRVPYLGGAPHMNPFWRPMQSRYRCLVLRHECRPIEIDGHRWGRWTPDGPCSSVCEYGTRPEKRMCYNAIGEIVNASLCIGGEENSIRSVFCNEDLCREYSNWLEDSTCYVYTDGDDVMCVRNATRTCIHEPEEVEMRVIDECMWEMRPCEPSRCDFTGVSGIGNWTTWSACNCSCKPGWQSRVGICIFFDNMTASTDCENLEETEYRRCNTHLCEEYTAWAPVNECSKTCETGIVTYGRSCLDPSVTVSESCTSQLRQCNTETCPNVDYGNFTEWTPCNSTCYVGYQSRVGICINKTSLQAASTCPDGPSKTFTRACNTNACVRYGAWGPTGACSVTCGLGTQDLTRTCEEWLDGSSMEVDAVCFNDATPCSLPGCVIYTDWSSWSMCSETCEKGVQTRTRQCVLEDDPLTSASGCLFGDTDAESQLCNLDVCDSYSDFEEFCEVGAESCQAYANEKRRTCNGTGISIQACLTTPSTCNETAIPQYDIGIILDQTHDLEGCKDQLTSALRPLTDLPILPGDPLYNNFTTFLRQKQFLREFYCRWDSISGSRSQFGAMSSFGDCNDPTSSYWNKLNDMNIDPFINNLPYVCGDLSHKAYFAYCHRAYKYFDVANGERLGVKNVLISVLPELDLASNYVSTFVAPLETDIRTSLSGETVHFFSISALNYTDSAYDSQRAKILTDYYQFTCIDPTATSCDYFLGSIYQPIEDVFQKIRALVN